ncbi:MAG TPA: ABC transporter substrate-binding protein [Candidatus Acidoferrales bacterium]|jgi:4,5-dihydroxyphthalate decarboxylase|nr:ABC transporter substrate-binding protein [Candidatus Acidoferrales bacterium]
MPETQTALTLQTLLAVYPNTAALRNGEVRSPLVNFTFADVKTANKAFKALVREQKFDLGELAIVTFLQAKAYGKPYVLMPATVVARGQHHTIFYNPERGLLSPRDLQGRKVGVRSYTQTTGAWVRGFLQQDYGVDFRRVQWITFEDPHVAEFTDPPWVQRAPEGKQLMQMLLDGEIDAAIFGSENPEGTPLKSLIPDAAEVAARWAEKHGGVPINHMLVIRESIAQARPDVVREVYRMLKESTAAAPAKMPGALRFGVEAVRASLETIIEYSEQQGLIPRRLSVDEVFNDVIRSLV